MLALARKGCSTLQGALRIALAVAAVPRPHVIRPHHHRYAAMLMSPVPRARVLHCCWPRVPGPITAAPRRRKNLHAAQDRPREPSIGGGGGGTASEAGRAGGAGEAGGGISQNGQDPQQQQQQEPARRWTVLGQSQGGVWTDTRNQDRFDAAGEYRVYKELLEGKKTRFVSRVMYDGTNYQGFQLQSNGRPTVQEVLENTLSQRFQMCVPVGAAGRTDTGVHAIGQAVHFDLPNANEDLAQLTYSMNQMMPADVRVWNMTVAPPSSPTQAEQGLPWSSMLNARGKVYSYRLFLGQVPSPLDRLYRAHASHAARAPVDPERLYQAIPLFVGEHDFAGFSNEVDKRAALRRAEGIANFNTRRTVYSADVVDEGGGNIRLEFHLDGALYRMVRNMVGTLLAIGAGRCEPEVIEEIFRTGVRNSHKIYAAPAHGLTLETVHYDGYG